MNVTVLGLWHLGSVTAACCAKHFQATGLDFDAANIANLNLERRRCSSRGSMRSSPQASPPENFFHYGRKNRLFN